MYVIWCSCMYISRSSFYFLQRLQADGSLLTFSWQRWAKRMRKTHTCVRHTSIQLSTKTLTMVKSITTSSKQKNRDSERARPIEQDNGDDSVKVWFDSAQNQGNATNCLVIFCNKWGEVVHGTSQNPTEEASNGPLQQQNRPNKCSFALWNNNKGSGLQKSGSIHPEK